MASRYATNYQIRNGDNLGDPTFWNARFQDIDSRIAGCEAYSTTIQASSQDVVDAGIAQINDNFTPLLNTLTVSVNALQDQVNTLQFTLTTSENSIITQMNSLLAQAQGIVDSLENLGTIEGGTF